MSLTKLPPEDQFELFTLQDFRGLLDLEVFADEDGDGYYATAVEYGREFPALPSKAGDSKNAPDWATHVAWFNR